MTTFKNDETYTPEGAYTFKNSPEAVRRLPFPFPEDEYMYSMNLEPHVPAGDGALRALVSIAVVFFIATARPSRSRAHA